jgi:hypothetical protein
MGNVPGDAIVEEYVLNLDRKLSFYAGTVFIGLDRGDVGEYAVTIAERGGPEIIHWSFHKEVPESFDSYQPPKYAPPITTDELHVWIVARTTGANDILRPGQPWSSRPDFNITLWTWPMPEVVPPLQPDPNPSETLYIPWIDRENWASRVDFAYTVWRGERDLASILTAHGRRYLRGGDRELLFQDEVELRVVIEKMTEVNARGDRLAHRILTERHRFYPNRSQVRKRVANDMIAELERETAKYAEIASRFPLVAGCDAIECKIRKLR